MLLAELKHGPIHATAAAFQHAPTAVQHDVSTVGRTPDVARHASRRQVQGQVSIYPAGGTEILQTPDVPAGACQAQTSFNHLDQEPVVITNSYNDYSDLRSVIAFMRYDCGDFSYTSRPKIHVERPSDVSHAAGQLAMGLDPSQNAFYSSGDPAIAQNPYALNPGSKRMYIAGTTYSDGYTQVSVWRNDNGGVGGSTAWAGPAVLGETYFNSQTGLYAQRAINRVAGRYLLDKPSMAVSYHSGTLGWVYVVAAMVDNAAVSPGPVVFPIYRSTDGGLTFERLSTISGDGQVSTTNRSFSPQIVVDNLNGNVYVFWLDSSLRQLRGVSSSDRGLNWQLVDATSTEHATGRLLGVGDSAICPVKNGVVQASGCVNGRSMLTAKFNPSSRRIGFAWHVREQDDNYSNTDVVFASYSVDGGSPAWRKLQLAMQKSQWAPAIDYDNSGNFIMSYYDRRDDATEDRRYGIYISKISADALKLSHGSGYSGDVLLTPGTTTADPEQCSGCIGTFVMGEYQGLWTFNGYVYSTFFYSPQKKADIFAIYLALP